MSSPSSPRRVRLGVAALLALLLVAGCTGQKPTPTSYGNTTRTNFLRGCQEAATDESSMSASEAEAYCKCSYAAIVDRIPYDRFKDINSDLSDDPDVLPKAMLEIRNQCIEETSGSG